MSLTGLDSPAVEDALKVAQQERGGWFMLRYETRDTVGVLGHGSKGLQEMRDAASTYYSSESDIKPLFGFTQFRRRKVLIRLVPDDVSRLFKARVQVHLFALIARFPAYDTTYEITKCEQFDDHQLGQHIDLHSSRSSAGSLKKPALGGIDEIAEESSVPGDLEEKPAQTDKPSVLPAPRKNAEDTNALIERTRNLAATLNEAQSVVPEAISDVPHTPDKRTLTPVAEAEASSAPKSYAMSMRNYRFDDDNSSLFDLPPRLSSQTARPGTSLSMNDPYAYLYQPKIKLGPRPSLDKRPQTSRSEQRAVAALPSSIRSQRLSVSSTRPQSREVNHGAINFPPPPPIPDTPISHISRRPSSSGASVKSLPATLPKNSGMTPEKARLLKFREMYRQKEARKAHATSAIPPVPPLPEQHSPQKPSSEPTVTGPKEKLIAAVDHTKTDSGVGIGPIMGKDEENTTESVPIVEADVAGPVQTEAVDTADPDLTLQETEGGSAMEVAEDLPSIVTTSTPASVAGSVLITSTRASSVCEHEASGATELLENETTPEPNPLTTEKSQLDHSTNGELQMQSESQRLERQVSDPEPGSDHVSMLPTGLGLSMPVLEDPARNSSIGSEEDTWVSQSEKRHALINPISCDSPVVDQKVVSRAASIMDATDSEYDDDLMDELDSAVVEEAAIMPLPKSPVTPYFSRSTNSAFSPEHSHTLARKSTASLVHVNSPKNSSPAPPLPSPSPLPYEMRGEQASYFHPSPTFDRVSALPTPPRIATPPREEVNLVVPKKGRLATGVAAKIADLQRNFSGGSKGSTSSPPTNKNLEGVRKASLVTQRANALAESSTTTRSSSPSTPWVSRMQREKSQQSLSSADGVTPEKDKSIYSSAVDARINLYESAQTEGITKGDSMTVTATIVRTGRLPSPSMNRSEPSFTMHENPIMIGHLRSSSPLHHMSIPRPATTASARPSLAIGGASPGLRSVSAGNAEVPASSSIATYPPVPPMSSMPASPRRSMDSTHSAWRSFTRRMSKNDAKSPSVTNASFAVQPLSPPPSASPSLSHLNSFPSPSMTRSPSIASLSTLGSVSESGRTHTGDAPTSPKKKRKSASRASRMMRRMSSGMSSIASITRMSPEKSRDTVATIQDVTPPSQSVRPPPLDLGDLNVQFPDNLLWKRRWVSIDSAGFMILQPLEGTVTGPKGMRTVSNSSTVSRDPLVSTKRFHLTEFWAPFAPDLERRELNHSIVLDLKDGRCLQYACSGVGAQVKILRLLLDAWRGWQD